MFDFLFDIAEVVIDVAEPLVTEVVIPIAEVAIDVAEPVVDTVLSVLEL